MAINSVSSSTAADTFRAQQSTGVKPTSATTADSATDPVKSDTTSAQQSSTPTSSNGITGSNINTTA